MQHTFKVSYNLRDLGNHRPETICPIPEIPLWILFFPVLVLIILVVDNVLSLIRKIKKYRRIIGNQNVSIY